MQLLNISRYNIQCE